MTRPAPAYLLQDERFLELLAERSMNLTQFAARSGVPERTLATIRSGEREVTMKNVARILDALPGVDYDYLFGRNPKVPKFAATS